MFLLSIDLCFSSRWMASGREAEDWLNRLWSLRLLECLLGYLLGSHMPENVKIRTESRASKIYGKNVYILSYGDKEEWAKSMEKCMHSHLSYGDREE